MKINTLIIDTICCLLLSFFLSGCAVLYYDEKTGTEHLWGLGHMRMKFTESEDGLRAVVKGTEVLGACISFGQHESKFVTGWNRTNQLDVVDKDTSLRLEWPNSDIFNIRIGSTPPFMRSEKGERSFELKDENSSSEDIEK